MCMYLGIKCRSLQVLLHQIATMHLYRFILMFSYIRIVFACWAVKIQDDTRSLQYHVFSTSSTWIHNTSQLPIMAELLKTSPK